MKWQRWHKAMQQNGSCGIGKRSVYSLSQKFKGHWEPFLCTSEVWKSAELQHLAFLRGTISLASAEFLLVCLASNLERKNTNWQVILERFLLPVLTQPVSKLHCTGAHLCLFIVSNLQALTSYHGTEFLLIILWNFHSVP